MPHTNPLNAPPYNPLNAPVDNPLNAPTASPLGGPPPVGGPALNPERLPPAQQAYGQPGQAPNPYAPPTFDYQPIETYDTDSGGSYGLGMLGGLVFSLLGLIIAYVAGKGETKRGALHGFLIRLGITLFIVLITMAS
ncbi:MAG: hypothetical protein JKY37_31645 [Nannocystaceae bacterium]|nr:hypothetical protein [Nannocystaceae bacterium]